MKPWAGGTSQAICALLPFVSCLVFFASVTAKAGEDQPCPLEHLTHTLETFDNGNRHIPSQIYTTVRTNDRSLTELKELFGHPDLVSLLDTIGPGQQVLDAGGAYSIYGLTLAGRGARVTVVDPNDYYSDLLFPLADPVSLSRLFPPPAPYSPEIQKILGMSAPIASMNFVRDEYLGGGSSGIRTATINRLAEATGTQIPEEILRAGWRDHPRSYRVAIPASRDVLLPLVQDLMQTIVNRVKSLERSGHFIRKQGTIQTELKNIPDGSLDVYFDINGGYLYSTNRLALLQSILSKLRNGGKGVIGVDVDLDRVTATSSADEARPFFFDFLSSRWPKHFAPYPGDKGLRALVIRKIAGRPEPDLLNHLRTLEVKDISHVKRDIPTIHYMERVP